jgi:integrase
VFPWREDSQVIAQSGWAAVKLDGEGHRTAIHKAHERIRRRSQVSFVPHDLRRTAASHMTSMGISRLVVSKILNHVEKARPFTIGTVTIARNARHWTRGVLG